MKISTPFRYVFCLAVSVLILWACAASAFAKPRKFTEGPCSVLFGVRVCSFYQMRSGKVSEFGLTVPLAAIQRAPANPPMNWPPRQDAVIPFAPEVEAQTGFTFADIYAEAHGHPPQAYMSPHFDFHFYFISQHELEGVDCKDSSKPSALPAGYALPDITVPSIGELTGLCVPLMGMHAVPDADLTAAAPWAASMLVGYYSQKPIFLEPMVSSARLLEQHGFSLAIPRIEPTAHVRYPKRFRAVYLAKSKTYNLIFSY